MKRVLSKVSIALIMIIGVMALSACGSGGSKTLSEYIGSDKETLAYYIANSEGLAKDTEINALYVFKGDQVDEFYGSDLTLGDVASMTDEETIEYCKNHGNNSSAYSYQVLLFTDDTGNNAESEVIRIQKNQDTYIGGLLNGFNDIREFEVYSSVFTAFCYEPKNKPQDKHNWLAFENAPTLTFDTPNSGSVIVDPFSL